MGKQARANRAAKRAAASGGEAPWGVPRTADGLTVPVPPGYPGLGWRAELLDVIEKRSALRRKEDAIVAQALAAGVTMSEIGRAIHRSRQTAHARYKHLRPKVMPTGQG